MPGPGTGPRPGGWETLIYSIVALSQITRCKLYRQVGTAHGTELKIKCCVSIKTPKYWKSITGVGRSCRGRSGKHRQRRSRPKSDCRFTRKKEKKKNGISFEVFTSVTVQNMIFWDVTLRSVEIRWNNLPSSSGSNWVCEDVHWTDQPFHRGRS
jgi:hypothetical protein